MKKNYITPKSKSIEVEMAGIMATSPGRIRVTHDYVWQYDGDQLHDDWNKNNPQISGPASEYVGGENDENPVNEGGLFDD